jgi:hypothetical protein
MRRPAIFLSAQSAWRASRDVRLSARQPPAGRIRARVRAGGFRTTNSHVTTFDRTSPGEPVRRARRAAASPRVAAGRLLACVLLVSLHGCGTGYDRDGDRLVFVTWDEGQGRREHPIDGADPESFRALNDRFAADASAAYFEWKRIERADAESFVPLSDLYARDAEHVFYMERVVGNADPATFALISAGWGRDARDVYLQDTAIGACDPATFELLADDWQRDARCAYNKGRRLPDADPASFAVVSFTYAKDGDRVFHNGGAALAGADAATFRLRGQCTVCGEDKGACYRFDAVVPCDGAP